MRLTKEELDKVKKKYGVDKLYSWSKVNCFMTSPYEYFLKYILHKKEDIDNCAYAPLGGISHSIIEDYYSGKIGYDKMIDVFEDGWLTAIDISDLKFDRNDESKNESIKNKYKENLQHFFKYHKAIETNIELERFLSAKIGDYVLQGYADAIFKDNDGCYNIVDWKTSTKYSSKALEEHSGQLTVYAIALNQLGVPLDKIKCCFNFLKYCTVQYEQANGVVKTRDVERCKLGESLKSNLKVWIKKLGYEEQMNELLKMVINTNGIDCLPIEIRNKYAISDCYCYIDLNEILVNKWVDEIISTIKDIELREKEYEETHNERLFWDNEESVKSQSYYFATLSGYSANLHKPYKEYLDKLESSKNTGDMFGGLLGSNNVSSTSNVSSNDNSLEWLNSIL